MVTNYNIMVKQTPVQPHDLKSKKTKMKVTSYNNNTKGTVMIDQMAHNYHLSQQLEIQQKKLAEQLKIVTQRNLQQNEIIPLPEKTKKRKEISKNLSINSDDSDEQEQKIVKKSKQMKKKSKGDKIKNYDVKIHVNNEVIHKNFDVNITKNTTTTKKITKIIKQKNNAKNQDKEIEEIDYHWEIERDWNLTYYRRQTELKPRQKADLEVIAIENFRKRYGHEGELLIHFKDGRRDWAPACACKYDAKAKMYNDALKRFNLTNDMLEYGLSRKKINTIEKNKGKEKQKSIIIFYMLFITR